MPEWAAHVAAFQRLSKNWVWIITVGGAFILALLADFWAPVVKYKIYAALNLYSEMQRPMIPLHIFLLSIALLLCVIVYLYLNLAKVMESTIPRVVAEFSSIDKTPDTPSGPGGSFIKGKIRAVTSKTVMCTASLTHMYKMDSRTGMFADMNYTDTSCLFFPHEPPTMVGLPNYIGKVGPRKSATFDILRIMEDRKVPELTHRQTTNTADWLKEPNIYVLRISVDAEGVEAIMNLKFTWNGDRHNIPIDTVTEKEINERYEFSALRHPGKV